MNVYFFSDPHFGHGNIMKYCRRLQFMTESDRIEFDRSGNDAKMSFESICRMNQGLIDNINSVVQRDDILWCLGDWCFASSGNYLSDARHYRDQIKCQNVHLVLGNHDRNSLRKGVDFASVWKERWVQTECGDFYLRHHPCASWTGQDAGVMHLYGHVHAYYHDNPSSFFGETAPAYDVGVDVEKRYGVWSDRELAQRLQVKVEASKLLRT